MLVCNEINCYGDYMCFEHRVLVILSLTEIPCQQINITLPSKLVNSLFQNSWLSSFFVLQISTVYENLLLLFFITTYALNLDWKSFLSVLTHAERFENLFSSQSIQSLIHEIHIVSQDKKRHIHVADFPDWSLSHWYIFVLPPHQCIVTSLGACNDVLLRNLSGCGPTSGRDISL